MIYTTSYIFDICYYSMYSYVNIFRNLQISIKMWFHMYLKIAKKEEIKSDAFWLFLL